MQLSQHFRIGPGVNAKIERYGRPFQIMFVKSDDSGDIIIGEMPYALWDVRTAEAKKMSPLFTFDHPNEPDKVPQIYGMANMAHCDIEVREGEDVICTIRLHQTPLTVEVDYH
jgi:hypothetical protein